MPILLIRVENTAEHGLVKVNKGFRIPVAPTHPKIHYLSTPWGK